MEDQAISIASEEGWDWIDKERPFEGLIITDRETDWEIIT